MTPFTISLLFFGGGLAILLFSGDMLTKTSVRLASLFGINPLIAGLTITAFATSAPEAAVAIHAALNQTPDIALGNVIGSNTANILLVLGLPAIFAALSTEIKQLRRHLLIMLGASFLLPLFALFGEITRAMGVVLLLLVLAWVIYSFKSGSTIISDDVEEAKEENALAPQANWIVWIGALASALGLWAGASLTLNGAQGLAAEWQISHAVVGLTLIALGTSLPELATSIAALWQKQEDIAIGNIIGSNLLNILFVLGVSSALAPLKIDKLFLAFDIPVMLFATLCLMPFAWFHKPITRPFGLLFVALYILYLASLIELRPAWLA